MPLVDRTIDELPAASQIASNDLFVLQQGGEAKKLQGRVLVAWLTNYADGHGGIQSIEKTGTEGLVDTYTIALADGSTVYFTVTNGAKGDTGQAWYVHIKYASQEPTPESHTMGDIPDAWMGVYSGTSETAPTDYTAYKWYKIEGAQGATGAAATVVSTGTVYQISTDGTVIPSGEWLDSVPEPEQGKYLWSKATTQFNSGDPQVSYSVSYMGRDGTGTVNSVNGVTADESGDVPLDAADIPIIDDATGDIFRFGVENGKAYIQEV